MLGILVIAALFWATGAMPVGITALAGRRHHVLPRRAAARRRRPGLRQGRGDLHLRRPGHGQAIGKTGLDRRIGLLLLGPATTLPRLLFLFLPLLAVACSFLSEHALVAFIMPLFMMVYASSMRAAGRQERPALAVMFVLSPSASPPTAAGPGRRPPAAATRS